MGCFLEAADRDQTTFLPALLEDYVTSDNPVRVIDAFAEELDLAALGFAGVQPDATGRAGYLTAAPARFDNGAYALCLVPCGHNNRHVAVQPSSKGSVFLGEAVVGDVSSEHNCVQLLQSADES